MKLLVPFLLVLLFTPKKEQSLRNEVKNLKITIVPTFQGTPLQQDTWYVTRNRDSIQVDKLRFYFTQFSGLNKDGEQLITTDTAFLVDAFDATSLELSIPLVKESALESLHCNLGVPNKLHDAGALAGALDPINGMYWAWQSGFINFKLEGTSPSCPTRKNKYMYHIGGYKEPFATTQELHFEFAKNIDNNLVIAVDIEPFLASNDLKTTNQLMIPGQQAYDQSLKLPKLFTCYEK
jgi:hypothetical protein